MKKFFRRSLACIIAVVMIATSLPFSAITAGAATSTTPITRSCYGVYATSDNNRTATNGFVLVNDSQNSNFSVGYVTFDISGINYTEAKRISAIYTFNINRTQKESLGVSVYYPTENVDSFATDGQRGTVGNIWSGNDGNHISRAKTYWGLKHIASYPTIENDNSDRTVDLGPAIVAAKKAGKSTATIVFMLSKAGGSGQTNGYSDSTITCSNTTASATIYDFSDRNFTAYEAKKYGSFLADSNYIEESYYNNSYKSVLYAPNNISYAYMLQDASVDGQDKVYAHVYTYYGNTVLLYNGSNTPQFPVGFGVHGDKKPWNWDYDNLRANYCRISDGANGLSFKNKKWQGKDGRNNVQYIINQLGEVNVYSDNSSVDLYHQQGQDGYYANIMQYTGGDFSDSYKKIDPTFEYKISNDKGSRIHNNKVKTADALYSSGAYIYVLNYKKIVDKVNSVNSFLETFDDSIYDTTTLNAYYNAIYKMFAFDPSLYDYDANTEQAVKDAANDMDSLIAAVDTAYDNLKLKKVTVSFRTQTNNVIENRVIEYGSKIGAFPSNSAPQTHNDDPFFIDEGKHVRFSWPTTYTADDVVTSDIIIKEVSNAESCTGTATCTAKAICTVCGLPFGAIDPDNHDPRYAFKDYTKHIKTCSRCDKLNVEEAHTDDGTGHCQYCRHVLLDTSALDSAKTKAENILNVGNADGKYVEDTYQNLSDVYNRIKNVVPTTEDDVNSLATDLLTAISSLISSSVTITFTKSQNGTPVGDAQAINATYGDTVELTVSDGNVEKWEIKNRVGKDNEVVSYVRTGENTLSLVVTENISVIAHLAENSTSPQNITKVVFMGRNNNLVAIKYLEPGISFPTSDVAIPAIPFYTAIAWDKTEVVGLENGGEITVRAKYDFNVADADAHKCGIHFKNFGDGGVRKYNYDSFVKLYGSSTYYGMYSGEVADVTQEEANSKLLTYFKTDEFYAPHNSNIYVYELPNDFTPTASVGVTGSYQENYDTKDVAAFNCKFFVPDDAKVVEWGIKATAGGTAYNFKSNNKTSRNEYTFKVNVAKAAKISSVLAKAYIIYIDGEGNRITLLSNNEVPVNFN